MVDATGTSFLINISMQVRFTLEEAQPIVTISTEAVPHFRALSEGGCASMDCHLAGLKSTTLSHLTEVLATEEASPAQLALSLSCNSVTEMLQAHLCLSFSETLLNLLFDTLLCVLQEYDNETLAILCDVIVPERREDEPEEADFWFLSATQLKIRNPAFLHRLQLLFYALYSLLGDRLMAAQCVARVPLPTTQLEQLCVKLALSSYFARVIRDCVLTRPELKPLYIVCTNPAAICVVNAALFVGTERERMGPSKLLKSLLTEQDVRLKRQVKRHELSASEKDALMVHRFLGWAMTEAGHALYVYYRGPSARRPTDLGHAENWAPVPVDLLRYFHSRLPKDMTQLVRLNSSDVVETADGHHNPQLDVRFVAHKWAKKKSHSASLRQLESHGWLFSPAQDSLVGKLPE